MAEQEYKHIIRIANADIDGNKKIGQGLTKVKGVGVMFANMVCTLAKVDKYKKSGNLNNDEVIRLTEVITNPSKFNAPAWLFNRRKDIETGEDIHIITGNLKFLKDNDIKMLKKIKSYRGMRHATGRPVRGQRTRSNFRKNKGKVTGVQRKKVAAPAKKDKK